MDTGAFNHMTEFPNSFSSYETCEEGVSVSVADGKISTTMGIGTVVVADLVLSFICSKYYNLLSVSKLTRDINYAVTFSSSRCEFQQPSSRKNIGQLRRKLAYTAWWGLISS